MVSMILTRAGVYVKKTPAARSTSNGGGGGGRVSVADAQQSVKDAITDMGLDPDDAIISKLTVKAANYFAELLGKLTLVSISIGRAVRCPRFVAKIASSNDTIIG